MLSTSRPQRRSSYPISPGHGICLRGAQLCWLGLFLEYSDRSETRISGDREHGNGVTLKIDPVGKKGKPTEKTESAPERARMTLNRRRGSGCGCSEPGPRGFGSKARFQRSPLTCVMRVRTPPGSLTILVFQIHRPVVHRQLLPHVHLDIRV